MAAPLNTLALGDEAATGLGLNVPLTRALASLAGVLCARQRQHLQDRLVSLV